MRRFLLAAVLPTLLPLGAAAQDNGWSYGVRIYGWAAGLETSVETPQGTVDSDLSIHDVLSDLSWAFMGAFEARRGKWSLIGDLVYANITVTEKNPFGGAFSKAAVEPKLTAVTALAAYRVFESEGFAADLGAGLRYVSLDTEVRFSAGTEPSATFDSDENWADPILGFRVAKNFNDSWYGRAYVDAGGAWGGDSSTWQALLLAGYRFNPVWSAEIGYRHMHIANEISGNDLTIDLSGPMIGVAARF